MEVEPAIDAPAPAQKRCLIEADRVEKQYEARSPAVTLRLCEFHPLGGFEGIAGLFGDAAEDEGSPIVGAGRRKRDFVGFRGSRGERLAQRQRRDCEHTA